MSTYESLTNTVVGYIIAVVANYVVLNALGATVDWHQSALIGIVMTLVSIPRNYAVRRFFNYLEEKGYK